MRSCDACSHALKKAHCILPLQPCASGFLWYSSKHAADNLLNRSKSEAVWLRDPRTGHDLALSVKKSRRPGFSSGCSTTTSRINVMTSRIPGMNFHSGAQLSTASNSSSYLPVLHPQLSGYAAAHHSAELHTNNAGLAVAAGMHSGSLDPYSMLQNANVMRLLPLQHGNPSLMGPAAAAMLQGNAQNSGYMAHDVCEAMLDYCDSAGLNMGMPVHLQPAMAAQVGQTWVGQHGFCSCLYCTVLLSGCFAAVAFIGVEPELLRRALNSCGRFDNRNMFSGALPAHVYLDTASLDPLPATIGADMCCFMLRCLPACQMATRLVSTLPGLQPRPMANSQMCCLPTNMITTNSGQHCMSSPANIQGLDEFEGSFNMPSIRGHSSAMLSSGPLPTLSNGMATQQQLIAQQLQQQQQQLQQQQQQLQQAMPNGGAEDFKSMVVPINAYEVQLIAEHLTFFAAQSGAQVTITSLPGTGLAVMMSGQHEQVAMAQSLLASARGRC
jgi:hypothetical protein